MGRLLLGAIVVLTLLLPVHGQSGGPFTVGAPVQIRNQPIDVSRAMRTTGNATRSLNLAASQGSSFRSFNFSNLFSKFSLGTQSHTAPQASVLPQKQNIFQPNPPKGAVNLFDPIKQNPKKNTGGSAIKIK